jgi:hypothetical protein
MNYSGQMAVKLMYGDMNFTGNKKSGKAALSGLCLLL